jgi:hypothetical protein
MTIKAHFDGKVFVPDEPVHLPKNHQVTIDLESNSHPRPVITSSELAASDVVGIWADRSDIGNSVDYVNQLRRRAGQRQV